MRGRSWGTLDGIGQSRDEEWEEETTGGVGKREGEGSIARETLRRIIIYSKLPLFFFVSMRHGELESPPGRAGICARLAAAWVRPSPDPSGQSPCGRFLGAAGGFGAGEVRYSHSCLGPLKR
jgi:hypothetical protein